MKLLDLKNKIPEKLYEALRVEELRPPQALAIKAGLLEGKNLVVASPTASGKTLVAEIACVKNVLEKGGKAIYLTPLKALAHEKYADLKEKYPFLNTMLSVGDFDSSDPWLQKADIIVCSNEKLDSLIRHSIPWLSQINTIIIDEIHVLDQPDRGPTLEIIITRLKEFCKHAQIIALSATIKNAKELAEWLNAELVKSDYRPVQLEYGIFVEGRLWFAKKKEEMPKAELPEHSVILDTLAKKKQILIFLSSRRNAEAVAKNAMQIVSAKLSAEEKKQLSEISSKIIHALETPTRQCEILAECVKHGTAFHHAGLVAKQHRLIEDAFRQGSLKLISATPTLCLDSSVNIWKGMLESPVSEKLPERIWALNKNDLVEVKPMNLIKREAPDRMIRLSASSGDQIVLTPNHKVLVKREGQKKVLAAYSCKIKDKIALVGRINIKENYLPRWSDFVLDNKLPFEDKFLDDKTFYVVGAMLGDGYSGAEIKEDKVVYKGSPCIVGKDDEIFKKIKAFCSENKIRFKESRNYYGTPQLVLSKCKWLREFLVRCGVDIGCNKYINEKLLISKKEMIASLLQGLFDTDGCVERKTRRVSFSNNSLKLIKSIRKCLLRYGIVTSYRTRNNNSVKLYSKVYRSKENTEIYIQHRKCLFDFFKYINFSVSRKVYALDCLLKNFGLFINRVSCSSCNYELFLDTFGGRTAQQREWGSEKIKVIDLVGKHERGIYSYELRKKLGFIPWKNEKRLNHHFNLIIRKRIGNTVLWKLNAIGTWVYENILQNNNSFKTYFQLNEKCPLCNKSLNKSLRGTWKTDCFESDIYWGRIKTIKFLKPSTPKVYDMVLRHDRSNEHLFVANGFIVHNSYGCNLPAHTVLVRDLKRYSDGYGNNWIPTLEVQQMFGRAGRPQFDKEGRALMIARNETEREELFERYVKGEPEEIYSKLSAEPILRMQTLGLVASNEINSKDSLLKFFSKTFFAHQYQNLEQIEAKLEKVINQLVDYDFISISGKKVSATLLGKRVAELYIDPDSANLLLTKIAEKNKSEIFWLHAICSCTEMRPLLRVSSKEFKELQQSYLEFDEELPQPNPWDNNYEGWLNSFKTSLLLLDWINETSEANLLDKYNEAPGTLRNRLFLSDWLIYSANELARIKNAKETLLPLRKLRLRVQSGVKEELLNLLQLEGVGRIRARKLFRAEIKTISDVKKAQSEKLVALLGKKTAEKVRSQTVRSSDCKAVVENAEAKKTKEVQETLA